MQDTLGPLLWADFVVWANKHYRAAFVCALPAAGAGLRCVGGTDGTPCPHAFEVDLSDPDAGDKLQQLHVDHNPPIHLTCRDWIKALPAQPRSWDDGVDCKALCHTHSSVCKMIPCVGGAASSSAAAHAESQVRQCSLQSTFPARYVCMYLYELYSDPVHRL